MFCESHFTSSNINCYSLLKRKQLIASSYWMFTVVKQLELFSHLHVHLIFWYQIHQILLNWKDHFIEAGMKICSFLEWLVWEKVLTDMYRMMIFRWLVLLEELWKSQFQRKLQSSEMSIWWFWKEMCWNLPLERNLFLV